jgi:formate dehydrogenase subunit delta
MHTADLVRMSTQIAQFFEPYPEDEAVAGVAEHLLSFWDPGMRRELLAMHRAGDEALHPLVQRAAEQLSRKAST